MSVTVFVVFEPKTGQLLAVSPHLTAEESLTFFKWNDIRGEVYAALLSESGAFEVRETIGTRKNAALASKMLKTYSHSLTKVGDV
jgi:hypothetical protein